MKVYLKINGNYKHCTFSLLTKLEKCHSSYDKPSVWGFQYKQWIYKAWYKKDWLHREIGPATIWKKGDFEYWLNDVCYYQDKQKWEQELLKLKEEEKSKL